MKDMGATAQRRKLLAGIRLVARFRVKPVIADQRLIRAKDQRIRTKAGYRHRLGLRESRRDIIRTPLGIGGPQSILVDIGPGRYKSHAGIGQKQLPRRTCRGKDHCHFDVAASLSVLAIRFMIDAAVSSTERRVTSIIGQLFSVQSDLMRTISCVMCRGSA